MSSTRFLFKNLLIVLLLLSSRVGEAQSFNSTSNSTLYVVIAGNGACRRNSTFSSVPGLVDTQLFRSFVETLLLPGRVGLQDNVIFTCYEWQSPQMKFYELRGAYRQMLPIHESQLDQVVASRLGQSQRVVIIGHSHAGWRAMKLASSPLFLNSVRVPILLATIDPVSRVNCQRLRDIGCRQAPTDLSAQEMYQLNTRTRWLNLYHEPAIILGSSPIAAAHWNVRINANHVRMQTDPNVWWNIARFVGK